MAAVTVPVLPSACKDAMTIEVAHRERLNFPLGPALFLRWRSRASIWRKWVWAIAGTAKLRYLFEHCSLDTDRRELRCGPGLVPIEPQVFDLLEYLIRNRERVVSRDDLLAKIWHGRIVSDSALTTRINAARAAISDSGDEQRLIKTLPRKGIRFVGAVREERAPSEAVAMSAVNVRFDCEAPGDRPSRLSAGQAFSTNFLSAASAFGAMSVATTCSPLARNS